MKKQAPKGKWRYGCVKRTYVTILPDETFTEHSFEVAEVFNSGKLWSAEARAVTAESKAGLIRQLERVIKDLKSYPVIVEKKPFVNDMTKHPDDFPRRK